MYIIKNNFSLDLYPFSETPGIVRSTIRMRNEFKGEKKTNKKQIF